VNPLPESPFAFQDRIMSALCEDILDPQAMREGNFPRLDALRGIVRANAVPAPRWSGLRPEPVSRLGPDGRPSLSRTGQ
jgi:hypothetical protein